MGNVQNGQIGSAQKSQVSQQVVPFIKGQSVQEESKLNQYLKQREQLQISQGISPIRQQVEERKDLFEEINYLEKNFEQDTKETIREHYEQYSFQNIMGQKKCLEYFGLLDVADLNIGNIFFQGIKGVYPKEYSGPYLDYSKFLKAISLLSRDNEQGRLKFTFDLFDRQNRNMLDKDDLAHMIESMFDCLMEVQFQNEDFQDLKCKIKSANDRDIYIALRSIVDDVIRDVDDSDNGLNFEGYLEWIKGQTGYMECINFNPHDIDYE